MISKLLIKLLIMSKYAMYGIFLQCIFYSLIFAGNSEAQKSVYDVQIVIELDNASIEEALIKIDILTDFKFFYKKKSVKSNKKISMEKAQMSVGDMLRYISKESHLQFKRVNETIFVREKKRNKKALIEEVINSSVPVDKEISGKVTDENGNGLPGVSVLIKGTNMGVVTDIDGNYTMSVPDDASTLIFSYVGYTTEEVNIGERSTIDLMLIPDIELLTEVVVIGYGTQQKKELTSAVSQTTGEEILRSPAVAITNSLAGRLPGVIINQRSGEPGRDAANILIRGSSTTGNNSPLIVIDGVANRDGISRLDPNDIESVTVLKDASAAIYGAQSSGGVILITTKRGTEGKPVISYGFNQGFVKATRLPDYADAASYAQARNDIERQFGRAPLFSEEDIRLFRDGSDPVGHPNTDWYGELFSNTSTQNRHNLSVKGGNEKVRYFLSLGKTFQDDLFKSSNTEYNQYNFRSNIDASITDNLTVSLDLAGRKENREWYGVGSGYLFWQLGRQLPTQPIRWPNGSLASGIEGTNPILMVNESGYNRTDNDIFNGTISFKYDLPVIDGLSFEGFYAIDNFNTFRKNFETPWFYYDYDQATDTYTRQQSGQRGAITLFEAFNREQSITSNLRVSYTRTFGSHIVSGMVGYEQNETDGDNFNAFRRNFDTDAIDQFFAGSTADEDQTNDGSGFERGRQSLFGRVSYSYKDKYLAQFNFRYDGSVNFPVGDRFGFFPGVSFGWRISDESFMDVSFIDDLKLRASWGVRGNDRIGEFQYLPNFSFGNGYNFGGVRVTGINPSGEPILDITWERHNTLNIGADISLFDGKFYLEADVFQTKTTELLGSPQNTVPRYAGFTPPDQNIGEMKNKGLEILTSYNNHLGDIKYTVGGNVTYVRNEVVFIDEAPWPEDYQKQEGQPLGSWLLYDAIGIYRDQSEIDNSAHFAGTEVGDLWYRDVNKDGEITDADRIRFDRNSTPELTFGFEFGLEYKNFDLNTLFQGQARAIQPVFFRVETGNVAQAVLEDYYTVDNPDASHPRLAVPHNQFQNVQSDFWLRDAWFVRLKNIELGYTLPANMMSKIGLQRARIYVSGFNLFTIDDIELFDPEINNDTGASYPLTKIFNLGVNISF